MDNNSRSKWYLRNIPEYIMGMGVGLFLAVALVDRTDSYDATIKKLALFGAATIFLGIVVALAKGKAGK